MAKKLYRVTVTVEIDMPVVAESAEEAEEIALDNYEDEPEWGENAEASAYVVQPGKLPEKFEGALPWGGEDDSDKTCETYLKSAEDE